MLKMSETADQYRLSSQMYKRYAGMFRLVLKGGGG
jgi:hypothetical protein